MEVQEDSWQAHKWFAVLTGTGTRFVGTNEKIQRGHKYKVSMTTTLHASVDKHKHWFSMNVSCVLYSLQH